MMWLLKRFNDDKTAAELFEERFQAAESAYEALTPDVGLAPYLDHYARLGANRPSGAAVRVSMTATGTLTCRSTGRNLGACPQRSPSRTHPE